MIIEHDEFPSEFKWAAVTTAGFETWATPAEVNAATNAANAPFIETSKAYKAALIAAPQVTFASSPAKPQSPDSFAGLLLINITTSGTYGIAASSGVWLDLIKDQSALKSAGQGQVPNCTGIHKIVLFDLQPGDYVLQIASSKSSDVTVQVAPQP
ncbi:hypothetical protein OVA03_05595 [Asticcacaulis sp. SL142]|uniref:hypothetical protein n=1 Tax=Asticcacaulis sp. SL142 TaxID=2995155 RepID=UPI00226D2A43|nr:hypothetical protein [Asticcacaulis sp. SL142]WAC49382.1 hypothetical protein OVA03_05595 [Asticcacaulis sp. SL142]